MPALIAIIIILISHLLEDKDFPKEVKTSSGAVFFILCIVYLVFGLVL